MHRWKISFQALPGNSVFQGLLTMLFLLPLAFTIGQFSTSGFFTQIVHVQIIFWPGVQWSWAPPFYSLAAMTAMGLTYIVGIGWLLCHENFSKVVLVGLASLIIAQMAAAGINHITGWSELQNMGSMNLEGKANRAILTLWHNPIWEEVVFRGIPLAVLTTIRFKVSKFSVAATWVYFIVPSIAMAAYHVPNHGYSRIVDTLTLSFGFAWMALRYGFFAPLVMHCIFDAMMVTSLPKVPRFPLNEIPWLVSNVQLLNTLWSLALLSILISIPVIIFWNLFRGKDQPIPAESRISNSNL
jgi:hypothetical protein